MKYYVDNNNNVYCYSDIQIPAHGLTEISEQQAHEMNNPPATDVQRAEQIRAQRDKLINEFRWRIERNRDERELGIDTTDDMIDLLDYVQQLRDVPTQTNFPESIDWPTEP